MHASLTSNRFKGGLFPISMFVWLRLPNPKTRCVSGALVNTVVGIMYVSHSLRVEIVTVVTGSSTCMVR